MFTKVSFFLPSEDLRFGAKQTVGGFEVIPVKNEKGARLIRPDSDIVETKAIGRGKMLPIISL